MFDSHPNFLLSCTDRTLGAFDDMLAVSEGHRISGQPNRVGGGRRFSASAAGQSINNSNRSGSGAAIPGGNNLDASSKLTDYSNSIREGGGSGADGLDVSSKLSESFSTRDGGSRSGCRGGPCWCKRGRRCGDLCG